MWYIEELFCLHSGRFSCIEVCKVLFIILPGFGAEGPGRPSETATAAA